MRNRTEVTRGAISVKILCMLLLLLAACKDDKRVATTQSAVRSCAVDTECLAQELCVFRLCSAVCFADNNCPTGAACLETGRGAACVRLQDNACVADTDCPEDTLCEIGRCTSRCGDAPGGECLPGRTCVDGICQGPIATETGSAFDASSPDPDGGTGEPSNSADADTSSEAPIDCPPGSAQCDEHVVTRCDDTGAPVPEENCPFLCRDGACTGECTPGERQCDAQIRRECDGDGLWVDVETCSTICTPEACTDACNEGARQCNGTTLMQCTNGAMEDERTCEFVCRDGACTGECEPGTKQCRNNSVVTCDGEGSWGTAVDCANACNEGACEGVCVPGTQRCGGDRAFQLCSDAGRWGDSQACEKQACVQGSCTGICSPGTTECTPNGEQHRCGPEGQWGAAMPCAAGTCVDGSCTGDCTRDARRCKPDSDPQVQTCDAQGRWEDGQVCGDRACFEGQCRGSCAPEARRCDPSDPRRFQICGAEGQWGDATDCAGGSMCADEGECGQGTANGCEPGQSPDWSQGAGGDESLNDRRWGGNLPAQSWNNDGRFGFTIVYDRAANGLSVQIRVATGVQDQASPDDRVYFGIGDERLTTARAVLIPLIAAVQGSDPRALNERQGFTWTQQRGGWSDVAGSDTDWIRNPAAWVDSDDDASWAVSFKVDLTMLQLDLTRPLRLAVGLRVAGEAGGPTTDFSTPWSPNLDTLLDADPNLWPTVSLPPNECVGRVANF